MSTRRRQISPSTPIRGIRSGSACPARDHINHKNRDFPISLFRRKSRHHCAPDPMECASPLALSEGAERRGRRRLFPKPGARSQQTTTRSQPRAPRLTQSARGLAHSKTVSAGQDAGPIPQAGNPCHLGSAVLPWVEGGTTVREQICLLRLGESRDWAGAERPPGPLPQAGSPCHFGSAVLPCVADGTVMRERRCLVWLGEIVPFTAPGPRSSHGSRRTEPGRRIEPESGSSHRSPRK